MKRNMKKELDILKEKDIIDDETYKRIQNYYLEAKPKSSYSTLLTTLAGSLIGLGVILLFAYNWTGIPIYGKLAITMGLLVISQILSYRFMEKKKIREGCSLFQGLMVGLNIAYISQVFNISGDVDKFFLVWMVLILPLIYLLRSRLVYLGYLGLIIAYTEGRAYFTLLILLGLAIPFLYMIQEKYLGKFLNKITALFFFVSTGIYLGDVLNANKLIICIYIIITLLITYLSISKKIGEVLTLLLVYIFSFSDIYSKYLTMKDVEVFSFVFIFLLGCFLVYRGIALKDDENYEKLLYLSVLTPLSLVFSKGYLVTTAYLVVLGFVYFNRYRNMNKKYDLYLSILLFGSIIMTKFSFGDSIAAKGFTFVGLGAVCLIANIVLSKKGLKGDRNA